MLGWIVLASALAAPSGWKVSDADADGCELSLGPAEADGFVPMRAECTWPEATLADFQKIMSDWAYHDEVFTSVVSSEVKRVDGERSLVWQKHQASGISDREILIWMKHEVVDGYERYGWTTADDEALTLGQGTVRSVRSNGYWQARTRPEGGIHVVHVLSYNPGGSVPGFMVRWFQTSGLSTNVSEVRAMLAKT